MKNENIQTQKIDKNAITEVLFLTSYPPRECGIATYSQDLIKALDNQFSNSIKVNVCALESGTNTHDYPEEVSCSLNTSNEAEYLLMADSINKDELIQIVLVQHEFGFFTKHEGAFLQMLHSIQKPVIVVFHTVLPKPDKALLNKVKLIADACQSIIVMTQTSADILANDYSISKEQISVIAHGTHLVQHLGKPFLKEKYGLTGRKVLTTFGLLSSGKSIETTLNALPDIIKNYPEVMFLIIGKTHPEVKKLEGEKYRESLEMIVRKNKLEANVTFINKYMRLPELLEYLQLTDIYLFTTNDPNQAVSGTFAYAMSCGCPIISTPIPHAKEFLSSDRGILFDFKNSKQLSQAVQSLLSNDELRSNMSSNTLQKIIFTAWENSAVTHAKLFHTVRGKSMDYRYNYPSIKMEHLLRMTTDTGIIQFSKINQPDIETGYTVDDNARALITACMYYKQSYHKTILPEIEKYLHFLGTCIQKNGSFLNYVDKNLKFTAQNQETNLEDSNGRAIWALGYVLSLNKLLPAEIILEARGIMDKTLKNISKVHSTRSMAFSIKGIQYYLSSFPSDDNKALLVTLANRLVQMYKHEAEHNWYWFENYLTYANSILPEAMLYAWKITGNVKYKSIALESLTFLLSKTFNENGIEVISNKQWLKKGEEASKFGEQPIDVAYTIMTLDKFYAEFKMEDHRDKLIIAFNWFLGENRLNQVVYNPCTGGCYDGMEENQVNLNQGAESTVSYLMARFRMEKYNDFVRTPSSRNSSRTFPETHFRKESKEQLLQNSLNLQ